MHRPTAMEDAAAMVSADLTRCVSARTVGWAKFVILLGVRVTAVAMESAFGINVFARKAFSGVHASIIVALMIALEKATAFRVHANA